VCGIAKLTPEQENYYNTRRTTRHRLDLRGVELHLVEKYPDLILEIEDGLQKLWADWQDQPDEIIVDNVELLMKLLNKEEKEAYYNPKWHSYVYWYRTKYSMNPKCDLRIPIFENI
jgi:hypothetical protein